MLMMILGLGFSCASLESTIKGSHDEPKMWENDIYYKGNKVGYLKKIESYDKKITYAKRGRACERCSRTVAQRIRFAGSSMGGVFILYEVYNVSVNPNYKHWEVYHA